jgi:2-polyprenyl-3-methyl-5-hydroxy-6-metoxy-1,4-benzoquinol methylase
VQLIPWRVKNFVSEHFPLAYHLAVNVGLSGNSREHWDAALSSSWDHPGRNWPGRVDEIARILDASASVLDVGCGNGSILRGLRDRGFRNLHGVEISGYAVDRLRSDGIAMTQARGLDISLPSESFDAVIASEVLEHMIRRRRFMAEIARLLKPTGRALIFVPDNCMGPINEPEHVIKYTAASLRRFLGKFFQIEEIRRTQEPGREAACLFALCRSHDRRQRAAR